MRKRILSILLCLVMVVGLLPTAVFAAGEVAIDEANFRMQTSGAIFKRTLTKTGTTNSVVRRSLRLQRSKRTTWALKA